MSPNTENNVTENQKSSARQNSIVAFGYNSRMKPVETNHTRQRFQLGNFGGKNRRFYTSALVMLLLVLAPFGLYAALNNGNDILAGILFAVITGAMLLMLFVA